MYQNCINFFLEYVKENLKGCKTEQQVDYYIMGIETFLEELRVERLKELI